MATEWSTRVKESTVKWLFSQMKNPESGCTKYIDLEANLVNREYCMGLMAKFWPTKLRTIMDTVRDAKISGSQGNSNLVEVEASKWEEIEEYEYFEDGKKGKFVAFALGKSAPKKRKRKTVEYVKVNFNV